jgi:uncharacterized membrane protein
MAVQASTLAGSVPDTREQVRTRSRILAMDALRGIALLLMALDHASFFVGAGLQAESYGGLPVTLQSIAYWGSGLLTNLASPIFWLLSGISLALFEAGRQRKGASDWSITRFMLIRAAIVLILDLTICNVFWMGQTPYVHVLTTMAVSIAILSVARLLPTQVLFGLTVAILLVYQAFLGWITPQLAAEQTQGFTQAFWLTYSYDTRPAIGFPVLGWGVLMWLGFVLGRHQSRAWVQRPMTWIALGTGLLALWLGLRLIGGYGDLGAFAAGNHWSQFLIMSKAPPSLTYLLFNLGFAALILAAFYARQAWLERYPFHWLVVVGQVSLFFYVAHIVVYNLIAHVVNALPLPGPRVIWGYGTWAAGVGILLLLGHTYRRVRLRYPRSLLRYL